MNYFYLLIFIIWIAVFGALFIPVVFYSDEFGIYIAGFRLIPKALYWCIKEKDTEGLLDEYESIEFRGWVIFNYDLPKIDYLSEETS